MNNFFPYNRLQKYLLLRKRRMFFVTFVAPLAAICCSTLFLSSAHAADSGPLYLGSVIQQGAYVQGGNALGAPDGTGATSLTSTSPIRLGWNATTVAGTITGSTLTLRVRSNGTMQIHILDSGLSNQCTLSTINPASNTVYNDIVVNTTSCAFISAANMAAGNIVLSYSRNAGSFDSGIDSAHITFYGSGTDGTYFRLANTTGNIFPSQSANFHVSWQGKFAYPDQAQFGYFFPFVGSGHAMVGCSISGTCSTTKNYVVKLFENTAIPDGLTASGTYNFAIQYPNVGTYTGSVLFSSNCAWSGTGGLDLQGDIFSLCHYEQAFATVTVGSFQALTSNTVNNVVKNWTNGGGTSSGAYLASDKQQYERGEPVYLRWYFNMGSLAVSSVKLYSGSGTQLLNTFTGTASTLNNTNYYAKIFYQNSGTYQPRIRVCVGDCSTIYRDIYIGGGTVADASKAIIVLQSVLAEGVGAQGFCTDQGVFGLSQSNFKLSFTSTGSNVVVQGIEDVANRGLGAFYWLAANSFCVLDHAPIISMFHNIVAPASGTYTMPTQWFCIPIVGCAYNGNPFPDSTYAVSYNETSQAKTIWAILLPLMYTMYLLRLFLHSVFPHHNDSR